MKSGDWISLKVGQWHHPLLLASAEQCVCTCEGQRLPTIKLTNTQMHAALPRGTRPQFSLRSFWQSKAWGHHPKGLGRWTGVAALLNPKRCDSCDKKHCLIWITLSCSLPTVEWTLPGWSDTPLAELQDSQNWQEIERSFTRSVTESAWHRRMEPPYEECRWLGGFSELKQMQ